MLKKGQVREEFIWTVVDCRESCVFLLIGIRNLRSTVPPTFSVKSVPRETYAVAKDPGCFVHIAVHCSAGALNMETNTAFIVVGLFNDFINESNLISSIIYNK